MPQNIKPDPLKHCAQCRRRLRRKRFNGTLESMNCFLRRKFCGRGCMAKAMVKTRCQSLSHSRSKANKAIKSACEACGRTKSLHVHHVNEDPRDNTPSNLRTLCNSCHSRCHSPNFTDDGRTRKSCLHCERPSVKNRLCYTHITRLKRFGHPLAKKRKIGSEWVLMLHDGNAWMPFPSQESLKHGSAGSKGMGTR